MRSQSDSYAQRFAKAVKAGKSGKRLQRILDGEEAIESEADKEWVKLALWAHNKIIPNPPQGTFELDEKRIPDFIVDLGDD